MSVVDIHASRVKINIQAVNVFLDIGRAIPCALIVNELVTNAMKHAFPAGRSGEIRIFVGPVGENFLQLEVSDTGVGLPVGIDFRAPTTLGMQLVYSLTKQLRGTVELSREEGTCFRVRFPSASGMAK